MRPRNRQVKLGARSHAVSPDEDNRDHKRHSLRPRPNSDLTFACDGITTELFQRKWWGKRRLGIANIKDISLGGIGFISSVKLQPNSQLKLVLQQQDMSIEIMRCLMVNNKLWFYGAKWLTPDDPVVVKFISNTHQQLSHDNR
ncbi:hypothetical protein FLM48_22360 [Shewanella sp. Scap07]|uniref:hypothetical protein n=1 Tax=Shewanella sp. Scap07 TaxID=2589987 RepID=UPI0015C0C3CB|nr:hypothetical protein [Shewanella sp. Scap07]QLE87577.1 hypothetical protein FLM48_22360 [Shewanella sp. Scap07]